MAEPKLFKKICHKCDERFRPTGKFQKLCEECRGINTDKGNLKKSYFRNKEKLDKLRDDATLKRWGILSEAYKTGKKIWGSHFTRERLANDMDMKYATVLRCLSLDRANKRSWELVEEGKISVFKLAMICQSKSKTYQDEIVNMVIEDNLSTYNITTLKIKDVSDLNKERIRLACEKGFTRTDSAYRGFSTWINKGKLYLLIGKDKLGDNYESRIKEELINLKERIDNYLG